MSLQTYEFRDVLSGEYCTATTDSESAARHIAAESIGADPSDLRRVGVDPEADNG